MTALRVSVILALALCVCTTAHIVPPFASQQYAYAAGRAAGNDVIAPNRDAAPFNTGRFGTFCALFPGDGRYCFLPCVHDSQCPPGTHCAPSMVC